MEHTTTNLGQLQLQIAVFAHQIHTTHLLVRLDADPAVNLRPLSKELLNALVLGSIDPIVQLTILADANLVSTLRQLMESVKDQVHLYQTVFLMFSIVATPQVVKYAIQQDDVSV